MCAKTRGKACWAAETDPYLIEAFPTITMIEVMGRQVEVTLYFDDVPDERLQQPKKLISRDPAVVAFHRRIHTSIRTRLAAAEAAVAREAAGEDAAA